MIYLPSPPPLDASTPNLSSSVEYTSKYTPFIPRPCNAFIVFRSEHGKFVKGFQRQSIISKDAAVMWNQMSDEEKFPYKLQADKERCEHRKKYPDYSYKTRAMPKSESSKRSAKKPLAKKRLKRSKKVEDVKRLLDTSLSTLGPPALALLLEHHLPMPLSEGREAFTPSLPQQNTIVPNVTQNQPPNTHDRSSSTIMYSELPTFPFLPTMMINDATVPEPSDQPLNTSFVFESIGSSYIGLNPSSTHSPQPKTDLT